MSTVVRSRVCTGWKGWRWRWRAVLNFCCRKWREGGDSEGGEDVVCCWCCGGRRAGDERGVHQILEVRVGVRVG